MECDLISVTISIRLLTNANIKPKTATNKITATQKKTFYNSTTKQTHTQRENSARCKFKQNDMTSWMILAVYNNRLFLE